MTIKTVLIIGATSAIAEQTARLYAAKGCQIMLCARDQARLDTLCTDLEVRGAQKAISFCTDLTERTAHAKIVQTASEQLGQIDCALIAHGVLPDQTQCQQDSEQMLQTVDVNALSVLSLCTHLANLLEQQQQGTLAVITSVAGDRGRQSNYVYGAAKGMVSIFLQGLRNRLFKAGVNVLDIKPGFVDTPMTAEFDKGALWAKPEKIATDIVKAVDKQKSVLYTPFFWCGIMAIIKAIPEFIFKRLSL